MSQQILVPMDDSHHSRDALKYALSHHPDAHFTVLHIISYIDPVPPAVGFPSIPSSEWVEAKKKEANDLLDDADTIASEYDTDLSTVVGEGSPPQMIMRYVDEHAVDHIIMGSHGRTGAERILLGSVAETVMRRSSVPVTVVRGWNESG